MSLSFSSLKRFSILAAALAPVALVTGCANMVGTAPDTNSLATTGVGALAGNIHGGEQPILGSTILLFSAGSTGYGSAGTQLAKTFSDTTGGGSFNFTQVALPGGNTTGVIDANNSTYACTPDDPQIYLIASGGDTMGIGSTNNNGAVLTVALGHCSTAANEFIDLDEVSTVATMTALQQFFNPNTKRFGYNSTPQSKLAFANAVATIGNLADISHGSANTSFTPSSSVSGVTVTGTPEFAKINTLADIIAACVNTASQNSDVCNALYSAAPPPAAATTSHPGFTGPAAPTDTLISLYYMLTNPTNAGAQVTECVNGAATAGNTACLYSLASPTSPFQPTVTAQPTDWTIGIKYDAGSSVCTGSGAGTGAFINYAYNVTADSSGNLLIGNGQSSTGNLSIISPLGVPLSCTLGNVAGSRGGAVLDSLGNIYYGGHTASTGTLYRTDANGANVATIATAASPGVTYGLAGDNAGNMFFEVDATKTVYEVSSTSTTPVSIGISPSGGSSQFYLAVDDSRNVYLANGSGGTGLTEFAYNSGTSTYAAPTTIAAGTSVYSAVVGSGGTVWAVNAPTGSGSLIPITSGVAGTPTALAAGGLSLPRQGVADGAGNIWLANNTAESSTLTAISEFSATGASLSPDGANGGFQKSFFAFGRGIAVDLSGNVWVTTATSTSSGGSAIIEVVGAAVPVKTPTALYHAVMP